MTSLYSQMKSYPTLNSFYKNFGFAYDNVKLEEEMRAVNNPNACLRYRLEPIETENINTINQIAFNMYVRSTEPVSLRELSIQLNYSNNWFGQNIVANNKLHLSDGDFRESYELQSLDISEDILEVSLRSTAPIDQLQLLSGSEVKLATVSIEFDESASELPILVENTIYRSLYYDEDGNLVRNSCGHIEIGDRGCGPIITSIDSRKAAGDRSILTISGLGFIHPSAQPKDEFCGLPNREHRVKFKSINSAIVQSELTISPFEGDYISWTNTEIQVEVPTNGYINNSFNLAIPEMDEIAGTNTITVCIDDTDMEKCVCFDESGFNDNPFDGELYIPYSATTGIFPFGECEASDFARLKSFTDDVANDKVDFLLTSDLTDEQKSAFERALETWRCETGINIESVTSGVGITVNMSNNLDINKPASTERTTDYCLANNKFLLRHGNLSFNENLEWSTSTEDDIDQDKFDFESVALHEIGHALGLIHTCNMRNVMFSFIEAGEVKRKLHEDDIEGGKFIQARSIEPINNCGADPLTTVVKTTTSVENENDAIFSSFDIFPNLTFNDVRIQMIERQLKQVDLKMYNTAGALILTQKNIESETILSLTRFKSGVYFIKLETADELIGLQKVIKL